MCVFGPCSYALPSPSLSVLFYFPLPSCPLPSFLLPPPLTPPLLSPPFFLTLLPFSFLSSPSSTPILVHLPVYVGMSPLHIAAFGGQYEAALVLLMRHADPNAASRTGDTPLHLAAQYGHSRLVRIAGERDIDACGVGSREGSCWLQ